MKTHRTITGRKLRPLKWGLYFLAWLLSFQPVLSQDKTASITIHPNEVLQKINPDIYGQFLEHLYHSVSNGIWGEMVWNRSFEEQLNNGKWSVRDKVITADAGSGKSTWQIYGTDNWKNYTIETDARIASGSGSIVLYAGGGDILKRNKFRIVLSSAGGNSFLEMTHKYRWQDGSKTIDTVLRKPGTIQPDAWVHLKVAYTENALKVWANDEPVFDYTSPTMPRQGTPGLGAENGMVDFKNYTVTAANGSKLVNEILLPARHWYFRGNGSVDLSTAALNERTALHITATADSNTLGQHHFSLKKGDVINGSVWLKGITGKLVVRFVKGVKVLAQTTITHNGNAWKENPFTLSPMAGEPDADLEIITVGKADFSIDQLSLMPRSALETGGFRPDLFGAAKALQPAFVRWPGGSFVEYYDFVNGIGPQSKRIGKQRWDDYDPLSFGLDEYMLFCEKTGAQPQVVLPVGYHNYDTYDTTRKSRDYWFQKAMDEMEYCLGSVQTKWGAIRAKNGHPAPYKVKLWELDNEVWKMSPDDYVAIVKRYAPAMRKKYPGITIIACGSGALSNQALALDTAVITKAAQYVDLISIHYYDELNKYQSGIDNWKNYVAGLTRMIKASANPQLKIFWSEWNLTGTDMRTGLYAGAILNEFEKDTMIQMACPALWLRHTSATGWDNAFINFDQKGYFLAPNYLVNKLWRDHFAPYRIALENTSDSLNLIATKSADGKTLFVKIVNASPSERPVRLKAADFNIGSVQYKVVRATNLTDKNTMEQADKIVAEMLPVTIQNGECQWTVPKYSAGVIELKRAD